MSVETDTRVAIRDALATALGIDFVDGKIEGPLTTREVGCIWPDGWTPVATDANYVTFAMTARVLLMFDPQVNETDPQDPADLEAVAEAIATTVSNVSKTTLSNTWITVEGVQYDVEAWLVDVSISAEIPNPYDPG